MRKPEHLTVLLLGVALAAGVYSLLIFWTGGFSTEIAGVRIRSHNWMRPAMVAFVARRVRVRRAHQ